jgi:hypothetical protein
MKLNAMAFHLLMFQRLSKILSVIVLLCISNEMLLAETITEENPSDLYLGSCYAVQYLKLQYCPSINAIKMSSCVNNLTKVAHKNNEEDMQLGFRNRAKLIMPHIIKSIDQSFAKHLAKFKGNRLQTCSDYQKDMNESMKKFLDEFKASQNDMNSSDME